MDTIGSASLVSFLDGLAGCVTTTNTRIRQDRGYLVSSYADLAARVAELQFRNREHLLLFRGQRRDHRNRRDNTTLKPSLFRPQGKMAGKGAESRWHAILDQRFRRLEDADRRLIEGYRSAGLLGVDRIAKHRLVRWAILQHYEICATPLLDVTQSLRIAASFAALEATDEAFVYVLGVPQVTGFITASAEAGVELIRLASACPPGARRPHIQEGYLLGEYPEIDSPVQSSLYAAADLDFGKRLLGKFRFVPRTFWSVDFPQVPRPALYPDDQADPLLALAGLLAKELSAKA